jgi:hypothetical protein
MMCPRVSVVIPVFRSEQVLARALGSLLAQDEKDWEAVVVDDGSPDASWRVTQAYAWIDPRIRTMRLPHAGVCAARNAGIAHARGEYLLFLDADDWLEHDALSRLSVACEQHGRNAVHGAFRYAMPDGSPTHWSGGHDAAQAPLFAALCSSNVLSVPACVMIRRSVLDRVGLFDTSLAHCGDWDLWGRVARDADAIGHVSQCVANYRMSHGSLSRNPRTLMRDAMVVLNRLHGTDERARWSNARHESGGEREQLAERIAHFAIHAAGLAAAEGNDSAADAVLDLVPRWTPISSERAGAFLFYSMCFAHCCGPESLPTFWPAAAEGVQHLLASIERRTRREGLADEIFAVITRLSDGRIVPLVESDAPSSPATSRSATVMSDTMAYETLRLLATRGANA